MSPFRLFGRRVGPADDQADPWLDDPAPVTYPAAAPPTAGPATAAARPSLWTAHRPPRGEPTEPEPVTDPFGFPPVAPPTPRTDDVATDWAAWAPEGGGTVARQASQAQPSTSEPGPAQEPARPATVDASLPTPSASDGPDRAATPSDGIDPAEACALAGAFAADLLSWDEDDPARRGRALGAHLASPEGAGLLGWTGTGRQRADLVLPGRVRADGERMHVDVRVRVVPYRRVDARTPGAPEPEPEPGNPLGEPAAAPAPAARGWRGLGARWVRIEVVVRAGDRLVVDAGPVGDPPAGPSPAELLARAPGRPR